MLQLSKMLMIGGAVRNVGKTSLAYNIVKQNARQNYIVVLKIKTIYPNDNFFHGKDQNPLTETENFRITEETNINTENDTSKMLEAGAAKSFKIKSKINFLEQAFEQFSKLIPNNSFIICESNSLREFVKPAIFIMIKHKFDKSQKPSSQKLEKFADIVIFTDGKSHDFDHKNIYIQNNKWIIKK